MAMKIIFHDMMHKNMEYYVDHTLAKSKKMNTHLGDFEFDIGPHGTISTQAQS